LSSAQVRQRATADRKSGVAGFLASSEAQRRREFRDTHKRIGGRVACLAAETRDYLLLCNAEQCAVAADLQRAADELRELAAEGETARYDTFFRVHDQIGASVARISGEMHDFLRGCNAQRRALTDEIRHAADQLRQQLADGDQARLEAFEGTHRWLTGRLAELTGEVWQRLEESHRDSLAARAIWNDLAFARADLRQAAGQN
jgi:argininosuccinate lyase